MLRKFIISMAIYSFFSQAALAIGPSEVDNSDFFTAIYDLCSAIGGFITDQIDMDCSGGTRKD